MKSTKLKKNVSSAKTNAKTSGAGLTIEVLTRQTIRQNRKHQRTRRHIAEVAIRLFEKKGFSSTTVDEIADAADYSSRTFFRLFADKEEVIFYDFSELLEDLKAVFSLPSHGNAWITIRNVFIEIANLWDTEAGELGIRRARVYHGDTGLYARFLIKSSEWEVEMTKLVSAEFKDDPKQQLLCRVIAGAAAAAFRAAFHTKLETEDMTLKECVSDAFCKLESIGHFFAAQPVADKKVRANKIKSGRIR